MHDGRINIQHLLRHLLFHCSIDCYATIASDSMTTISIMTAHNRMCTWHVSDQSMHNPRQDGVVVLLHAGQ